MTHHDPHSKIEDAIARAVENGMDTADGDPESETFYKVTAMTLLMIADDEHIDLSNSKRAQKILFALSYLSR